MTVAELRAKARKLRSRIISHSKAGRRAPRLRKAYARAKADLARAVRRRRVTLGQKAYREATRLVGIMEQGGNNRGREVEKIIAEGGGLPGQAWCGWFCAAVYKRAGSKAVTWQWGAVRLLWPLAGIRKVSKPRRGDLVRFTFDHVGLFVKDVGNGYVETIEGNTGATGAVSDSASGGDGVYRKRRPKYLVRDYLRVSR